MCAAAVADLVVAGQTPGRRRYSHCSSNVYGVHTLSLSGNPVPHRLSLATSGVAVDTCHFSGAVLTEDGLGTRSPEKNKMVIKLKKKKMIEKQMWHALAINKRLKKWSYSLFYSAATIHFFLHYIIRSVQC